MGLFSPKIKVEQLEGLFTQLQEQIVENGKLRTQLQLEIENKNQLNNEFSKQIKENDDLKNKLNIQKEKTSQISENYDKLISEYKKLKVYSVNLQQRIDELQKYEDIFKNFESSDNLNNKCFKCVPIVYQNIRKTSLEIWIDKLEKFISSKSQKSSNQLFVSLKTVKKV